MADQALAQAVAEHKSMFFAEKDAAHKPIDYKTAVGGHIQIIPEEGAMAALEKDYAAMLEDGLLSTHQPRFDAIMAACAHLQNLINR